MARTRLDYFYDKFFAAASKAALAANEDPERLYRLLQTAATPQGQLHPEFQELYKDCSAVFAKTTRASEVLQFSSMFKNFSDAPWVAEKLLKCDLRIDDVLWYVTFLANENKSLPVELVGQFHTRFVELRPRWAQFYDYITFFNDGAYCPVIEEYFFNSLSVGEFNQKKLWDLFPEWRTDRLSSLYERTTIYGLTLD